MIVPFFMTIDTEGDNLWERPRVISSKNVEKLERFQVLCEKHNIKPIYLTNFEAASNDIFRRFIERHQENLEVGLHLHAWNSPPISNLTVNDYLYHPYLHEYSDEVIRNKIDYMYKFLSDRFQMKIISHRGGKYSISDVILDSLYECGIRIDCSVVPGFNWKNAIGDPSGGGGNDFRFMERNIHIMPNGIIQVPMSTNILNTHFLRMSDSNIIRRLISKTFSYRPTMLRSKVDNLQEMKKIVRYNLLNNTSHLEYMIHSSELVNGTSHLITNDTDEDKFYYNLECFFLYLNEKNVESQTFHEFLANFSGSHQ